MIQFSNLELLTLKVFFFSIDCRTIIVLDAENGETHPLVFFFSFVFINDFVMVLWTIWMAFAYR